MSDIDTAGGVAAGERLAALYPGHLEVLRERHDRALERAGAAHLVIHAGAQKAAFLDDYVYPFKPNPHFVGWLPLPETPGSWLVYTPGQRPVLIYLQPRDYWHAPPADPDGYWVEHFDVRVVHSAEDAAQHLPKRESAIVIGEVEGPDETFGVERINPTSALNVLHYARGRKTAYELECMRIATRRAVRGHLAAEAAFRDGRSEYDIHLAYCRATGHTERELPYGNIIAQNEHGAIMHYQHQARTVPRELRSLLIDAGASCNGYSADITRTWSFESAEFADLVARVDALQRELVDDVRAGVDFPSLHLLAHRKVAELLRELDFASGSAEALIENGVTWAFFPTGLGHLLGLQVHDVGGFMADDTGTTIDRPSGHPFLRLTRTLEPDMVLTVEPGIYVIDMLLENLEGTPGAAMVNRDRVDWLRPFGGVRIEDNVRVLEDGCENLTRAEFAAG